MILKFTLRNITKRPVLNLIKVIGLSLALSSLLIIILFVKNELTYDSFHKKSNKIYRLTTTNENFFGGKHFARMYDASFIPKMKEYFPEIENFVRLAPLRGGFIKYNEKYFEVNQAFECDSTFLDIFDCKLLIGNPDDILSNPSSLIITESFAKKVFGEQNPIGKVLTLPSGQYYDENIDFTINGIMKDFPQNSHIHPEFITTPANKTIFNGWVWSYLLLSEKANPDKITPNFNDFYSLYTGVNKSELKTVAHLQKISDIHLHSNKLREIEANSNISVIYTLSIAALILLIIALINYANLNIGMAKFNEKFLFINKLLGSSNSINLNFYVNEGVIISIATFILSVFIVWIANMNIQTYFGLNLLVDNVSVILIVAAIFSLLSILSGLLPLLRQVLINMSSYLKSDNRSLKRKGISKSLIVFQYTISIALIVAVIVIQRQTKYALNSSMSVNKNMICFENVHSNVQSNFQIFKDELLKNKSIESVSAIFERPGGETNDLFQFNMEGYVPDETNNLTNMIGVFPCDYSFASIFNLKFLSGKNFSKDYEDHEGSGQYIINESAMKRLNYTDPNEIIGKDFGLIFNYGDVKIPSGKIIGVVKDFHFSSIKKEVEPLVFFKRKDLWISNFIITFLPGNKEKALAAIKNVWNKLFNEYPFEYKYVDSMYKSIYKTELLQAKLLSIFTFIALFICSMGLLGMSLLVSQRRTKEIGIRKVNGAKISQIVFMLNWSLIKWIVLSFIISIPIAYLAMNKWLENFAYKIPLSWWIFILAGLIAIFISLLTVTLISWKAAMNNPVKALRYE